MLCSHVRRQRRFAVSALVPVYASRPFPGPNVRSFVGADGDDKFVLVRVERDYGGGNFTVFARKIPDEVRALGVRSACVCGLR